MRSDIRHSIGVEWMFSAACPWTSEEKSFTGVIFWRSPTRERSLKLISAAPDALELRERINASTSGIGSRRLSLSAF